MKLFLTILLLFLFINTIKGQNPQAQRLIGKWNAVKDSSNPIDLFSSEYSFQFNKDKSFEILKPVEGQTGNRVDESGLYDLTRDSIKIKITREDGIDLVKSQSVTFKIMRLSDTELILQWPQLVEINGKKQYPELRFRKEK